MAIEPVTESVSMQPPKVVPLRADISASHLKELLGAISSFTDEAKLQILPSGVEVLTVDPAHVAMSLVSVPRKAFKRYRASETSIALDVKVFKRFLRLATGNQTVNLKFELARHCLTVGTAEVFQRMTWNDPMSLADAKMPKLKLPVTVTLVPGKLLAALSVMQGVSDHVALEVKRGKFTVTANGAEHGYIRHIPPGIVLEFEDGVKSARSLIPLDYLRAAIAPMPQNQPVTIRLGTDYPVQFDYRIMGGKAKVTAFIAPRIESGE